MPSAAASADLVSELCPIHPKLYQSGFPEALCSRSTASTSDTLVKRCATVSEQLAPHEQTAFGILASILIERDHVERDALRVLVASKGGAIGREYMRLRGLGLIEEISIQPNFLRRLFGAKAKTQVRLTEKGRKLANQTTEGTTPSSDLLVAQAQAANPDLQKTAVDEQTLSDGVDALRHEATLPAVQEIDPAMAPDAAARTPAKLGEAKAKLTAPKRFAPADYTDVLGGQADDSSFTLTGSERLDGLAELLGLMGFEITPAGNLLAANRWADGYSDPEVALEVLVISVAHAARLNRTGTARLDRNAMLSFLDAVGETMSSLVSEGHLTAAQVTESLETMRSFLQTNDRSQAAIDDLLSDPLRGMAPPAILPDEVWVPVGYEED